jgi:hypothetical protein
MAIFIVCMIGLSAGVTWLVVRISPSPDRKKKAAASADSSA